MNPGKKSYLIQSLSFFGATVCLAGLAVALIQHFTDDRMPTSMYLVFGIVQFIPIGINAGRRNLITSVFGACLTVMLLIAVGIENTENIKFDAVYSIDAYTPTLIAKGYHVLLSTSCLYHFLTIWFAPKTPWVWSPPDPFERQFSKKTIWYFFAAGVFCTMLTVRGTTILEAQYASVEYGEARGPANSAGLELLGTFFLVFALVATVRGIGFETIQYKLISILTLAVVVYFRVLRGDRGTSLILFMSLAVIYYLNTTRPKWQRNAVLGVSILSLYLFYEMWGSIRATASTQGLVAAFLSSWENVFFVSLLDKGAEGFNAFSISLFPQSYWHLLHTMDLYHTGFGLGGETFLDLIPQSIPQFISDAFEYERPVNGAWKLAEYRIHSGGMYIIAEGYWNFGLWGALLIASVLSLMAIKLEPWYRRQEPLLACSYFAFLGCFGFAIFYGLQPFVKSFEVALVIAFVFRFVLRKFRGRKGALSTREARMKQVPPARRRRNVRLPANNTP